MKINEVLNALWPRRDGRPRTKTRPTDWLMIQWARVCEETLKPDVSGLEDVSPGPRDGRGRLADPLAYLSARSERLLTFSETPVRQWLHRAKRFRLFATFFIVALGALAFPFARVNTILGDDVNLAGPFLFFLTTQIFFLTVALALACLVVLMSGVRLLFGRSRSISFSERVVQSLSSVVGSLSTHIFHRYAPYLFALFGKSTSGRFAWHNQSSASRRALDEDPAAAQEYDRRRALSHNSHILFWDVLFSRPRVVAFWSSVLSHAFWASCSLCVLVILMARMQGNRYDYCWRTSLEDERAVKYGVDILGSPIAALGIAVPSDSDVAALFEDELAAVHETSGKPSEASSLTKGAASKAEARQTAAEIRARWSYFLLSVVFVWCVIPRLVLVGIYYLLYRNALRDFRPSLDEEYFQRLVEHAESYRSTTRSVLVEAPEDDPDVEQPPVNAPAAPIWKASQVASLTPPTSSKAANAVEAVHSETSGVAAQPKSVAAVSALALTVGAKSAADVGKSSAAAGVESSKSELSASEQSPPEKPTGNAIVESAASIEPTPNDVSAPVETTVAESTTTETPEEATVIEPPTSAPENVQSKPDAAEASAAATEREEARLTSALAALGGLPESVFEYQCKPSGTTLAFSYDLAIASELVQVLIGDKREASIYGDAADFDEKKRLAGYLTTHGASVEQCVIFTDVGLPPARHFIRFLRETLTPALGASHIVLVLSGGERLRRKFATSPTGVAERLEDWSNTLGATSQASGKSMIPVFYYDAELDLPEPRERLIRQLSGADAAERRRREPRDLSKWDLASARILAECRDIFESTAFVVSDEADRLRTSRVCGEIFRIYHEELAHAAYSGASASGFQGFSLKGLSDFDWTSRLTSAAGNIGVGVGETLSRRVGELGLSGDFVESRLLAAYSLSAKMQKLCGKLSPKCALAAASIGLSIPAVVAFSPLLGGAVTASAVLSTVGALGSALPASLTSGVAAGVLGAFVPESLRICKQKLLGALSGTKSKDVTTNDQESSELPSGAAAEALDRTSSASTLAYAASTWAATLELQGLAEDVIVAELPHVLQSVEDSKFETYASAESALAGVRRALESVPRE